MKTSKNSQIDDFFSKESQSAEKLTDWKLLEVEIRGKPKGILWRDKKHPKNVKPKDGDIRKSQPVASETPFS